MRWIVPSSTTYGKGVAYTIFLRRLVRKDMAFILT